MRKSYSFLLITLLFLACFSASYGQTTIDAEFRPRTEYREGFRKPLADTLNSAIVTLQRTRLGFDYKGAGLMAHITLQDAHIWGSSDGKTDASKVEVYEAWFDYLFFSGFSAQIGRQPLKYDDQRLLANPNWSATGFAHDAAVFKYKTTTFQAHSGFAYNNSKDTLLSVAYSFTNQKMYKSMGYLWLSQKVGKSINASAIGIVEGFESKTSYQTQYTRATYGGNLVYANDSSAWGATLTGYYQQGKDMNKAFEKGYASLHAYFCAAKLSYKINKIFGANGGIDYYSGSASTLAKDESNTFNRLYGSTHSFNGSMEYFVSLPTQGLVDYYGGVTAKITSKLTADLSGHLFYFDHNFYYNKVKQDKNLGSEADVTLNYVASKEVSFQCGYSRYFNSSTTKKYFKMDGVATSPEQWAYITITVRPQLYKTPVVKD